MFDAWKSKKKTSPMVVVTAMVEKKKITLNKSKGILGL